MTERISAIVSDSLKVKQDFFLAHADDVERAATLVCDGLKSGGKLLVFGNGGLAADAQHIAGELVNRFLQERPALPAIALTTGRRVLTCIANHAGFVYVLARGYEALRNQGDYCLAI